MRRLCPTIVACAGRSVVPRLAARPRFASSSVSAWSSLELSGRSLSLGLTTKTDNVLNLRETALATTTPDAAAAAAVATAPTVSLDAALKSSKTLDEVVVAFEKITAHMRHLAAKRDLAQLHVYHLYDEIKLGAAIFKPAEMELKKKKLAENKKETERLTKEMASVATALLPTAAVNSFLNVLRVVGQHRPDVLALATRALDEATCLCGVKLDATMHLLAKSILFGDGPQDDSGLLFDLVEFPERGEISVAQGKSAAEIAEAALKSCSGRHELPLTAGVMLRSEETYPLLQRSPE